MYLKIQLRSRVSFQLYCCLCYSAETRNKELIAAMEEKQQEVAKTMFEIVEEAKDMTRQYYESQLKSMRAEVTFFSAIGFRL